jgi:putative SOS response-associated peptidase YedK
MCGRFVQAGGPKQLSERLKIPEGSLFDRPRFNVAPTTPIAAIRESRSGGRELVALKWGLIPSWSRDGKGFINARAETAAEKPTFRSAFKKRRCLIPADAFYEWQKRKDGTKQPFAIRLKGGDPFAFAGLWEIWTNHESGEEVESCTILTTGANELMKPIHDRMPVILPEDAYGPWLDQADASVLKPFDPATMEAYPVSTYVNNTRNEGSKCLEPLAG